MHPLWTDEAARAIGEIARQHGFEEDAGRAMAEALAASAGSMAQFHHPELGGMGQWSRGGMLMIGDMFNNALKGRVAGLAEDLADALARGAIVARRPAVGGQSSGFGRWWPGELGEPSSTGSQNGRRYAVFPAARRLAIETGGRITLYDTGEHRIGGASQQQGGSSSLGFSTERGTVGIDAFLECGTEGSRGEADVSALSGEAPALRRGEAERSDAISSEASSAQTPEKRFAAPSRGASTAPVSSSRRTEGVDPIELIQKLATLREAGVLTDEEFQAKKTELLARI